MRLATTLAVSILALHARADALAERAARTYAIDASAAPAVLATGERGVLILAIRPEPAVHVQRQAPLWVTLSTSPGLALAKERLGWADVVGPKTEAPRLELPFTGIGSGPQTVRARLEFFVCSSAWCVKQDREVVVIVTVGPVSALRPVRE